MFKIRNKSDFKLGYEILAIAKEQGNAAMMEKISDLKRELRHYAHKDTASQHVMGWPIYHRIIKEYGIDGYVELVNIPAIFDDEKNANEFFKDFIFMECRPSIYDCTGQPFTSWYKLFKRHGQFYVYHRVSYDV